MSVGRGISRRTLLSGAGLGAAAALGAGISGCAAPSGGQVENDSVHTLRYGTDPSQFAELTLPSSTGGPIPVAVVIHGGFWRSTYGLELGRPLAATLPGRGWAALNLEYRRVGNGGGYPATLSDVAAGIDLLADVGQASARAQNFELDLSRVITIGHSAGGHLAAWAATRPGQEAGSPGASPTVTVAAVVAQAGVLDLRACAEEGLGGNAAQAFLGGEPADVPERYDAASPAERLPLGVPTLCVHGPEDVNVPISQSQRYVAAASAAGDDAELVTIDGDHFAVIDAADPSWTVVLNWIDRLDT